MQKVANVLAVASSVVSLAVVGSGLYVYVNKDAIIQGVTEKALGGLGGLAPSLPTGANDLDPSAPQSSAEPAVGMGVPSL